MPTNSALQQHYPNPDDDGGRYGDAVHDLPEGATNRSLALIGFMGIGKTTVGGDLSKKLHWPLVDTDERIEADSNMTIREIFDWLGEAHFRDLERQVLLKESEGPGRILSLGGGAFIQPGAQEIVLSRCLVVYLTAPWSHVAKSIHRLKNTRPLLRDRPIHELEKLFNDRHKVYDLAHIRVSVQGRRPPEIANRIIEMTGIQAT